MPQRVATAGLQLRTLLHFWPIIEFIITRGICVSQTNLLALAAPAKPIGPVKFSNVLEDSVTLTWTPPGKDGGSPITAYKLEKSNDNGKTWTPIDTEDFKGSRFTVHDLEVGHKYKFRVGAVNQFGVGELLESDTIIPKKELGKDVLIR